MPSHQPPPAVTDPLVGRVLHGRYRVEAFVARGGMATVYRGADLRLDRTVAIKVMHPSFATDPGFVDRFDREARAAARLNSPHVVAIHDEGNDSGLTYLVMEYVPGHTVRDVLRTHGALPPAQALAILEPVLEALAAAHRAGYVHRDVKPENVLISEDGRVKVADFGLARAIEGAEPGRSQGLLLGTVAYLSPEQVEHDRTDARSDVYSAGILLYEMVTGQVPYAASTPMQVAYRHVHEDVPAPSQARRGIPTDVDALVVRATRRAPAERFGDATAFLAEVRKVRAALPDAPAWLPAPTDTLVSERGAAAGLGGLAAGAAAAGAAAAGAAGTGAPAPDEARARVGAAEQQPVTAQAKSGPETPPHADAPDEVDDPEVRPDAEPASEEPGAAADDWGWATDRDDAAAAEDHITATDEAARPPRRGRLAVWLGLAALAAIAGLVFVVFGPLQRVDVPDVTGRTPAEASATLATANLSLDASMEQYSETVPKGQIISTDPEPGGGARTGSTVQAVVSMGPERYEVPKLPGLTVAEAEIALAANNLELGTVSQQYHDKVKNGDIISSTPAAGASVKPETAVALVVSQGPAPVPVPDLAQQQWHSAKATLEDLGLKPDKSEKFDDTVPEDHVISTNPKAGSTAHRGDEITVVVSKGPPLVTVPNVIGMSEEQATSALRSAGFTVDVNKPFGTTLFGVRAQSPRSGEKAPQGSTVSITVV